jgi:cysteine desulfurase
MQIYLDHNSTTPPLPEVIDHMAACQRRVIGNPASQHAAGRQSRRIVEEARDAIAAKLGARRTGRRPDRLVFTSGGTESNNLGILGQVGKDAGRLIISSIEHPSVAAVGEMLGSRGWQIQRIAVDTAGVVRVVHLRDLLTSDLGASPRALVGMMLGNNETGVLQPVGQAVKVCREYGLSLHTDAVQVVGKLAVDFGALGADTLAFSAHKFHGPRGIGGLLVRGDIELAPILFGGFQQAGLRAGTEPVALIAGMHRALELWNAEREVRVQRMTRLRNRFEAALQRELPGVVINGGAATRLPHTSNVSLPGLDRRALAMALDIEDVACSTGSACASGSSEPSPLLVAMGLPTEMVASSLRFSLGATTTESEIDMAVARIVRVAKRMSVAGSHAR